MPLSAKINPKAGGPGTKVEITVEEYDVEEYSDYIKATVSGQPVTKRLRPGDEKGIFKTEATVPMGAYYGTYKINLKSVGKEETEETTVTFKIK